MKQKSSVRRAEPTFHVVHLLRHGQYTHATEDGGRTLTPLGKRQALTTARHLRRWPIERIWSSTLVRAIETANIVGEALEVDPIRRSALLREIVPSAVPGQRVPLVTRREARSAIDRILGEFLTPSRTTRHDLLVCHGNLIRALVCRVLATGPAAWLSLATSHCSLTTIVIASDGKRQLVRYGENSYLPERLISTS